MWPSPLPWCPQVRGGGGVDPAYEETARTLGAKPVQAFRRVLYPMIKELHPGRGPSWPSPAPGETGAKRWWPRPDRPGVHSRLINLRDRLRYYTPGLACIVLIIVSFVFMLSLRYVTNGGPADADVKLVGLRSPMGTSRRRRARPGGQGRRVPLLAGDLPAPARPPSCA
jgi:hypothetical protein